MSIKEKIAEIKDKIARIAVKTATVATLMGPSCACSENTQNTDKNEETVKKTGVVFRADHRRTESTFLFEDGEMLDVIPGDNFIHLRGLVNEGDTLIYEEDTRQVHGVRFKNAAGKKVNITKGKRWYETHR